MNKVLALVLVLSVLVTFAACGGAPEEPETPVDTTTPDMATTPDITPPDSEANPEAIEQDGLWREIPDWGVGVANWIEETETPTRIAVYRSMGSGTDYNVASYRDRTLNIKYIGEKESADKDFHYFKSYENTAGPEYEIIYSEQAEGMSWRAFAVYNSEVWGDKVGSINHAPQGFEPESALRIQITAMEQAEGGRRITQSELLGIFTLKDSGDNYLSLMRYENTDNGLFKIVLYDDMNNYFAADYPCEIFDGGEAWWRADLPDEPGLWELLFAGRVSEGVFLVTAWSAPEGRAIIPFLARDGKLEEIELPGVFFKEGT